MMTAELVERMEEIIEKSYDDMNKLGWIDISATVPDRNHPVFIDLCLTRLTLMYSEEMAKRMCFKMKEYIDSQNKTD